MVQYTNAPVIYTSDTTSSTTGYFTSAFYPNYTPPPPPNNIYLTWNAPTTWDAPVRETNREWLTRRVREVCDLAFEDAA